MVVYPFVSHVWPARTWARSRIIASPHPKDEMIVIAKINSRQAVVFSEI